MIGILHGYGETDWRILAALQDDARLTNADLAEKVFLSPSPCLRRVRDLEQAGLIKVEVTKLLDDVGRLKERVGDLQKHFGAAAGDTASGETPFSATDALPLAPNASWSLVGSASGVTA